MKNASKVPTGKKAADTKLTKIKTRGVAGGTKSEKRRQILDSFPSKFTGIKFLDTEVSFPMTKKYMSEWTEEGKK